jgi:hypothetical protein
VFGVSTYRDTDDGLRDFEMEDADGYLLFFDVPNGEELSRRHHNGVKYRGVCLATDSSV